MFKNAYIVDLLLTFVFGYGGAALGARYLKANAFLKSNASAWIKLVSGCLATSLVCTFFGGCLRDGAILHMSFVFLEIPECWLTTLSGSICYLIMHEVLPAFCSNFFSKKIYVYERVFTVLDGIGVLKFVLDGINRALNNIANSAAVVFLSGLVTGIGGGFTANLIYSRGNVKPILVANRRYFAAPLAFSFLCTCFEPYLPRRGFWTPIALATGFYVTMRILGFCKLPLFQPIVYTGTGKGFSVGLKLGLHMTPGGLFAMIKHPHKGVLLRELIPHSTGINADGFILCEVV